jgi:hypothetical protein
MGAYSAPLAGERRTDYSRVKQKDGETKTLPGGNQSMVHCKAALDELPEDLEEKKNC